MSRHFTVKTTGGTTAQLLGLTNAIWFSRKSNRPFRLHHFSTSTGTYWPFSIQELLTESEFVQDVSGSHSGLKSLEVGMPITVQHSEVGVPHLRRAINKFSSNRRINVLAKAIQREVVIGGKKNKLFAAHPQTRNLSGIFVPLVDEEIFSELSMRFDASSYHNPFRKTSLLNEVVIHYRLGDMVQVPSRVKGFRGHGVVDPHTFRSLLLKEGFSLNEICPVVVSDTPDMASKLLSSVGIKAHVHESESIWLDLELIARSQLFLGSPSQFSAFAATICSRNGGKIYLPESACGEASLPEDERVKQFNYHSYSFLPDSH